MNLGSTELLILAIIVVVVFGGSWLPKAARNLGRAKVEVDKVQKQVNDTKAQVIEATGIEKADEALRKANRALNSSPQSLMKNAAKSAITPAAAKDASDEQVASDAAATEPATDAGTDGTVNVDFTD